MTLKFDNTENYSSWKKIPCLVTEYINESEAVIAGEIKIRLKMIFAVSAPKNITYYSTTIAFCNRVATIIDEYDQENDDRYELILDSCKTIWNKVIKAEERILDLLNQKLLNFTFIKKIEKLLYSSLIDIALSPYGCRFLDTLTSHLKTKQVTLHINESSSNGTYTTFSPHLWIQLTSPNDYCCYQTPTGQRFWQTPSMENIFLHECMHHLYGHTLPSYFPLSTGEIWINWAEIEVIWGTQLGGLIREFSDRAFSENQGTPLRIGHFAIPHGISMKQRFLYSIRYGVTLEIEKSLSISNKRADIISNIINQMTTDKTNQLLTEGNKIGVVDTFKKTFHPYCNWFDVNSISQEQLNNEFDRCNHWPSDSKIERDSIAQIRMNHTLIRPLIMQARDKSKLITPIACWKKLKGHLNKINKPS